MYKRTVYLVFGKKLFGLWKREKIPSNEKGAKIPIKKIHIAQLQTLFPKHAHICTVSRCTPVVLNSE